MPFETVFCGTVGETGGRRRDAGMYPVISQDNLLHFKCRYMRVYLFSLIVSLLI